MTSLSKQSLTPDPLTGELAIPRRLRALIAVRELVGRHTMMACHRAGASGLAQAFYVCLACGYLRPCTDARAAGVYELLEGPGPIRLRAAYWQPPVPEDARDFRELTRLSVISRRWLALGGIGLSLTVFSIFGPNPILLVCGALVTVVAMNRYQRANQAWLELIDKQIASLDRRLAAHWATIMEQAAEVGTDPEPPDA